MELATKQDGDMAGKDVVHESDRILTEMFARVFRAYLECSNEIQEGIKAMVGIVNDPNADTEEKDAALDTIVEALFPSNCNGDYGADLKEADDYQPDDVKEELSKVDSYIQTFSDKVKELMKKKDMTQDQLAESIGVGQPAISMMLNRKCRPQRKTVFKVAESLGVDPSELWPENTE